MRVDSKHDKALKTFFSNPMQSPFENLLERLVRRAVAWWHGTPCRRYPWELQPERTGWSPTRLPRDHPALIFWSNGTTTLASGGFFRSWYADSRVAGTASRSRYTPISCSRILIRC